jgi:diaminobutyrate-2-oxoglutarate transaminase
VNILERYESVSQNYVRNSRIAFDKAIGSELFDESGARYIDFYSSSGTLSFGHNNSGVRDALVRYLSEDRIVQSSDKTSVAKRNFVEEFVKRVLAPRGLDYRILFTDPAAGTAAELALRLARPFKNRTNVIAFTNASHGLTDGSLSVVSKHLTRHQSLGVRANTIFMPYCGYFGENTDTVAYLRRYLTDSASGLELPAAVIVETVQVHGGVHVASVAWLKELEKLCREFEILLIVDETHTGCGRVGPYFSFEIAGLDPDMVVVPNAIGGGLPMSVLLLRPELDFWRPGEQVGTFQGDSLAFVAATELLSQWSDARSKTVERYSAMLAQELSAFAIRFPNRAVGVRGKGMIWGVDLGRPGSAAVVSAWALERGLIVEPARLRDEVLLVLPALTIDESILREGLSRLAQVVSAFLSHD